jgi:hypothetical protein
MTDWSRRFDDPIPMPDGRIISTIGEAAEYATSLPAKTGNTEPWQRAAKVLHQAAEHGGHSYSSLGSASAERSMAIRRRLSAIRAARRATSGVSPASWRGIAEAKNRQHPAAS